MSLADLLAARTLELVDIPSVSREEARITERVAGLVPATRFEVADAEDSCLLYRLHGAGSGKPLVVLSGHLDTVPPQGNIPGRREGGVVHGLGATDMKGGCAVMIELARWLDKSGVEPEVDLALLFFGREELAMSESPLPGLFERAPWLAGADLVVMLEPTDNAIHAGCMGNINAELVFRGESAHSARPWLGVNAIDRAVHGLLPITLLQPQEVVVSGLSFVEVLSITEIEGGIAQNVIPDRVTCHLNFRYAPTRSPEEADARLRELAGDTGELTVLSNSPSARVAVDAPLVQRLRAAGGLEVLPKQAWTPVAEFSLRGLDAVNLGPGATRFAHKRDEQVAESELARCFETLRRFVTGEGAA